MYAKRQQLWVIAVTCLTCRLPKLELRRLVEVGDALRGLLLTIAGHPTGSSALLKKRRNTSQVLSLKVSLDWAAST